MQVQMYSDLHIEYEETDHVDVLRYITPRKGVDILILAGDIGNLYRFEQLKNFLKDISVYYKQVFYVLGNHEFYKRRTLPSLPYQVLYKNAMTLPKIIPNLMILNNDSYLIDKKYCFIGSTLWSHIGDSEIFPFFRVKIHGFNKFVYNKFNAKNIEYIRTMLQLCKQRKWIPIVITHYTPTFKCIHHKHRDDIYQYLYANNLDAMLKEFSPKYWIAGHTHENFDFIYNNTRIVSNQLGKKSENVQNYQKDIVLTIE